MSRVPTRGKWRVQRMRAARDLELIRRCLCLRSITDCITPAGGAASGTPKPTGHMRFRAAGASPRGITSEVNRRRLNGPLQPSPPAPGVRQCQCFLTGGGFTGPRQNQVLREETPSGSIGMFSPCRGDIIRSGNASPYPASPCSCARSTAGTYRCSCHPACADPRLRNCNSPACILCCGSFGHGS
jgi:hypothetical protein